MATYETNFHKEDVGNAINSGDTLTVHIGDVDHATGAVYHEGFPIIADFDDNRDGSVDLKFRLLERNGATYSGLPTGKYILKVRSYKDGRGGIGYDDEFNIV